MSWSDYHLDDPTFCTPEIVAEGLVRALMERIRAFYIARDGRNYSYRPEYYPTFRNNIIPSAFYFNDRFYRKQFCRNFDAYLAWYAWAGLNSFYCPIAYFLGPLDPCEKTCQYYPWYGRDDTCKGYQFNWVNEDGVPYTLRSLLDAIGDRDLIDTSTLNTNQPSLFVPWVIQRVKMLKKLRHFKDDGPSIVMTTEECSWEEASYDSPYSSMQEAVDSVPRETVVETYQSNPQFRCLSQMSGGVCVDLELRLPVTAAPYYDEEVPEELKPKSGYLVVNVTDPFGGIYDPLNAPVIKGLTTFSLQEDGTFFSNWPTVLTLPESLAEEDYLYIGWDMNTEYAVYDFNSTFEFQDDD